MPPTVAAASLPVAWAATWVMGSGMTGLTFAGMIDEPGWISVPAGLRGTGSIAVL